MVDRLAASSPINAGLQAALPPITAALTVRVIEGLRVLALRHLADGAAAIEVVVAAHDLAPLSKPGTFHGADPWLVWTGPAESLLLSSDGAVADDVLRALSPGRESLACAVCQSAGWVVFELLGTGVDHVMPRLLDASSIPRHAGQAVRARLMDISAVVMRLEPDRVLIAVDRTHGIYAAQWIAHSSQATLISK